MERPGAIMIRITSRNPNGKVFRTKEHEFSSDLGIGYTENQPLHAQASANGTCGATVSIDFPLDGRLMSITVPAEVADAFGLRLQEAAARAKQLYRDSFGT
jgi:hypothetical protein